MIVKGRRIRNVSRYLAPIQAGEKVVLCLAHPDRFTDKLVQAGFTRDLNEGEAVLPSEHLGPVCGYNAEGKYIVHKDQPMETAYRQIEWTWEEWRGRYDTEEMSRIVDVPYQRYPRTFVPPPSIELTVCTAADGSKIIAAPPVDYTSENQALILHVINLFLELFSECNVLTEELEAVTIAPVRRLNWRILPPGRRPWNEVREEVEPIISQATEGNQRVIRARFQAIAQYNPEFVAIGHAGFRGYVIFGFAEKNLFVLESAYHGNATYVFDEDWEELSKKTKAEILNESLQKDRIIHREGWFSRVDSMLSG
jgi:hypothetical protein